ncbi:GDSL-type esterase/lipase family protein [Colwellia psychrerythraea]|uniref:SGNH hydrolase-type esterase domain-containing protein n=1 Tax=Colwellia psychrerythraea TaxID=28229 RepID=A0A099KZH0_COLPS|nr:GDSL-type esterase/lipase family protein [Colwellia psychrerythraea]KGJ96011.1 hypothetical protein GAB14E_1762 [Colwellia psychrerythraea]
MKIKYFKVTYIILIHLFLITVLIKYPYLYKNFSFTGETQTELTKHYYQMTAFHNRADKNLTEEYNLFIGDSLVQGLAVTSVDNMSVNYGIGSDTTLGVIKRLPLYNSIYKARSIILSIGHNDIGIRPINDIINNFKNIIEYLPSDKKIIICAIFLIDENIKHGKISNLEIKKLNNEIIALTQNYVHITYLDINQRIAPDGSLSSSFHLGDGVHLNKKGYDIWIEELKIALQ